MIMLGCVSIRRRIATTYMTADQANPQMHPASADFQTILTTLGTRGYLANLVKMLADHSTFLSINHWLYNRLPGSSASAFSAMSDCDYLSGASSEPTPYTAGRCVTIHFSIPDDWLPNCCRGSTTYGCCPVPSGCAVCDLAWLLLYMRFRRSGSALQAFGKPSNGFFHALRQIHTRFPIQDGARLADIRLALLGIVLW